MPDYTGFFLNSTGGIAQIECLELSHPSFTKVYRVQFYTSYGLIVKHENGTLYHYDYCPMQIDKSSSTDDLDQGISITLGDFGDALSIEFDRIIDGPYSAIKPTLRYRIYRSDDLLAPMLLPSILEVSSFAFNADGVGTFQAKAPELNRTKTGETYKLDRFPMLRGFL